MNWLVSKRFSLCLFLYLLAGISCYSENVPASVMSRMVSRLFPDRAESFVFREMKSEKDCFVLQSVGTKVQISGNNANSMAMGLNYYLRNYCLTTVSWYAKDPVEMPKVLPRVPCAVRIAAKVPIRFFLNYCTYGYTMPWWTWKDWERFIDWMALNGVNMPLAITGQESVWYNVWKKLGLTDEEIRSYFTGPAHLPWHRLCNIDAWQGPLPVGWLDNQKELQKKIVSRERELNMKPVLPAFSGHIPSALRRVYPHIHATPVTKWGSFNDPRCQCTFLSPMDSLFNVIQKEYLTEQTRLYGTDHIYGADPFNEVDPPSWQEDSLAMMSSHIYQSMKAVDKDATWLQMTWVFFYKDKQWTPSRMKAFVRAVPQDRMILQDYFCENTELWPRTESYYGQPFIWCYLGDFGGRTILCAPLKRISDRLSYAFQKGGKNFMGIGVTLEGFDVNQFAYEFVMDKAWNMPQSLSQWEINLSDRHVGRADADARRAYGMLCDKVLSVYSGIYQGTLIEWRPSLNRKMLKMTTTLPQLVQVWRQLLSLKNVNRDAYRFDVVNIGRQVLGDYYQSLWLQLLSAYESQDVNNIKKVGAQMKEILKDVDALVGCHSSFSFKNWIESARAFGSTDAERDYYEKNARTLLTVWTDNTVANDYARRAWSGLVASYYAPRWIRFIDEITACVEQHKKFDEESFKKECYVFERRFIEPSTPVTYPEKKDAIAFSKLLLKKYFH